MHELFCWPVSSNRCLNWLHELPHRHFPWHYGCIIILNLRVVHRRELLCHIRSLGRHGHVLLWPILCGCGVHLHQLLGWHVSSKRCFHGLHELPHGHFPRRDWCVVVGDLRSLHCRKLLRDDRAISRHGDMHRWEVLGRFGVGLHELPCGSVSSCRRINELHELSHGHFPRHDWSVVVGNLRRMHEWKLLRRDGTLGRYFGMRHRPIFGSIGVGVHELSNGSVSSEHRLDELHELPCWNLPHHDRRDAAGNLRSLHWRELLWNDGAFGHYCGLRCRSVFGFLGISVRKLLSRPISSQCRHF